MNEDQNKPPRKKKEREDQLQKIINDAEEKKTKVHKSELFDWAEALVISLTTVIIIFVFFVKLITVDGTSMLPTLEHNDRLVVSDLFFKPEYGDIIILTKESFQKDPIVKRVIATEGQTIDIDYSTGDVYVDGELLVEPYINDITLLEGDTPLPATVPENSVFVMGDNRNASSDSRVATLGMVEEQYILGRVLFRFYPLDSLGIVE